MAYFANTNISFITFVPGFIGEAMEGFKGSVTETSSVVSYHDLWMWMINFVTYMAERNQTSSGIRNFDNYFWAFYFNLGIEFC
jgi:hypothetical protein